MSISRAAAAVLVTLAVAGLGGAAAAGGQHADSPFSVGELFPDLAFPALEDGSPTRVSDFRGRKLMLHVFASW